MPRLFTTKSPLPPFDMGKRIKEIDMFFEHRDEVHKTMHRLVRRLEKAGIPHAVVGGMAANAHRYERTTKDVDVLLTRAGFERFLREFVPKWYTYLEDFERRFVDRKNEKTVDILVTGLFPGSGKPGPIAFPDPEDVRELINKVYYIDLVTLIQLKLAARRHRDFGDVVELIRYNSLDESFTEHLHLTLKNDYIECLEEKRREDEYMVRRKK